MTDDRDPILEALFAEPQPELDGVAFRAQLKKRSRVVRVRMAAGWLCAAAILLVFMGLLAVPVQEFAWLLAQGLTTALVDVGDGWWSVIVSPLNSVASVLVVVVKAARMGLTRIRSASFA